MENRFFLYSFVKKILVVVFCASSCLSFQTLATTIDFDSLVDLETVTNQFDGLTFSGGTVLTAGISLNEFEFPPASGDKVIFDEFGPIEIVFDVPMSSVSGLFTYFTDLSAIAFDSISAIVDTDSSDFFSNLALSGDVGSAPNEFLQLSSAAGISRVVFEGDLFGASFTLDDLNFTPLAVSVPEPSVIAMMLTGLLFLFGVRLRKHVRNVRIVLITFGAGYIIVPTAYAVQRVESVVATPALVFVDTTTTVRFVARVAPDDNLIPASVRLLRMREDGRPISSAGATMFDDGTNGDTTPGDLIFTAEVSVLVSEASSLRYSVSVAYLRTLRRTLSDIVIVRTDLEPFFSPTPSESLVVSEGAEFAVNEVLVGLVDGKDLGTAEALASSVGGEVVGFAPTGNLYQFKVPTTTIEALDGIIRVLLGDPRVTLAIRNYTTDSVLIPDSSGNDAEALPAGDKAAYSQIKAFDAWDLLFDVGHSFSPVVVGVLDRGFQNHGEFDGVSFTAGSTRSDAGWAAKPECSTGNTDHGTAVAGLIGAGNKAGGGGSFQTNGILGGVTDGSVDGSSVPYKLDTRRLGATLIENQTLISRMVNAGAKAINMSFGGSRRTALPVDTLILFLTPGAPVGTATALATLVGGTVLRQIGERVVMKVPATTEADSEAIAITLRLESTVVSAKTERNCFGASSAAFTDMTNFYTTRFNAHSDVMFVLAAGNSSIAVSDSYPSNINATNVLTVGASDNSSDATTAGTAIFTNIGAGVDIAAPGVAVYAPTDFAAPLDAVDYRRVNGTSFSSPLTAASVGLMLATDGTLKPEQLRKILLATATENAGVSSISGKILDLGAAIEFLLVPVDVFIIVDTSGSFGNDLASFRAEANSLVDALDESGLNIHMGLARFEDYPVEPWGASFDRAYKRVLDIQSIDDGTGNKPIISAINSLSTLSGFDTPESQLVALMQGATGSGQVVTGHANASIPTGQGATFRSSPVATLSPIRMIILWTDAQFHTTNDSNSAVEPIIGYPGPTFTETINALNSRNIKVIGVGAGSSAQTDLRRIAAGTSTLAPTGGVNCDADAVIEVAEGEPIVCPISTSGSGIGDAIFNSVIAVVKM